LNIHELLKERSSLQSIELSSSPRMDWKSLPESMRSSLVSLIQLPTVTHLNINSLKGFPATALLSCSNLISLQLGNLYLTPFEVHQDIPRSKILSPVSLNIKTSTYRLAALLNSASSSLHAGGPIVDFSRLQKAYFEVETRGDINQVYKLIIAAIRLECLYLTMNARVELTGLGGCLAMNAYRTLKVLDLNILVLGDYYDPLCGLCRELGFIAGNNILEGLILCLVVREVACQTESEDWSAFDSLLTESGAFPILHRVSIKIKWNSRGRDRDALLESLKEDKFPRLVESKAVEFNFSARIYYQMY